MTRAWIVQKPRSDRGIDLEPLEAIGEVDYLLPAATNIHDADRVANDLSHMVRVIEEAAPGDVFTTIGGSPISQIMFGAAVVLAALPHAERVKLAPKFNFGLYSRGQDEDGRRDAGGGSYRSIPVVLSAELF